MAPQHRLYTPEIAETILEWLSDGEGLKTICDVEGMPSEGAVRHWVATDHEGFAARYAHARARGLEKMADDIVVIADRAKDADSASAARVQVDARKWLLSKLLPKQFGDKIDVNFGVQPLSEIPEHSLNERLSKLLAPKLVITIEGFAEPKEPEEPK